MLTFDLNAALEEAVNPLPAGSDLMQVMKAINPTCVDLMKLMTEIQPMREPSGEVFWMDIVSTSRPSEEGCIDGGGLCPP